MNKFLKYSLYFLVGIFVSACTTSPTTEVGKVKKVRQAEGNKTGQLLIYTNNNPQKEKVSVFVNGQFITVLPERHQLVHSLCQGDYELKAQSTLPNPSKYNQIVHIFGKTKLKIVEGKVQYMVLKRTEKGWEFIETDNAPKGLKNSNDKLVRRMTNEMLDCK